MPNRHILMPTNEVLALEISHLREVLNMHIIAHDRALTLQAAEYERRLEELNHVYEKTIANWTHALPREIFESRMAEVEKVIQNTLGALTLVRFMGFSGVIALFITFAKMSHMIP